MSVQQVSHEKTRIFFSKNDNNSMRSQLVNMSGFSATTSLDIMNKACLLKLGWHLQAGGSGLWSEVLRSKYNRNSNIDELCMKNTNSSFWKNLVKLWPMLNDIFLWNIGNGESVDAWKTSWIAPNIKLRDLNLHVPTTIMNAKISELVDEDGDWNWKLLTIGF